MTGRADPLAVIVDAIGDTRIDTYQEGRGFISRRRDALCQAHADVAALVEAARAARDRSAGRLFDTDQETGETFHEQLSAALAPFGESP